MASKDALAAAQSRTLHRLSQVKAHFEQTKGSGRFQTRVAVITGAGSERGIGRATAKLLAREGAKALYLLDFDASLLPDFCRALSSQYPSLSVSSLECDAADSVAIQGVCEQAMREHGRLDFFFANAGTTGSNFGPVSTTDEDSVMELLRVNLLSCFVAVKHASAVMKRNPASAAGGSILLTASVAGIRHGAGPMDYSASKAGVINLATTSANQLAGTGIRVNALCPGLIETGMTAVTFDRARQRGTVGKVGQLNPLKRFGVAEEIAQAALWLASEDSSYVNGVALPVDGGLSSSLPVVPGQFH
ncbi:hypothetical protein JCM10213_003931 [Rhodosporidiobolus nylandii]